MTQPSRSRRDPGMDPAGLANVDAVVRAGMEEGLYPAAAYIILLRGEVVAQQAMGVAQPGADPPAPAAVDTVFDLASLTKPITAALLLRYVERGRIHLGQALADLLPEARGTPTAALTVRQLATHTSGLAAWKPLYLSGNPVQEILTGPLEVEPGTTYCYSDLGYILLGEILARVGGRKLDALVRAEILEPLEMTHSGYLPRTALRSTIAATANCSWREGQTLIGQVHDANAYGSGGVAGHAGLFAPAPDLARFAGAMQYGGLLGQAARRLASQNQIDPAIGGHSIGWFTHPNGMLPRGDLLSRSSFGHTGFTGTMLVIDPELELALILLTNRVYVPGEGTGVLRLRRLFANAAAAAMR